MLQRREQKETVFNKAEIVLDDTDDEEGSLPAEHTAAFHYQSKISVSDKKTSLKDREVGERRCSVTEKRTRG